MFSFIKDTYKKSEAAVVVQSLLERQQATGKVLGDPAKIASELVAKVWDYKPDVFNGTRAGRPHKMSVAAYALANAASDSVGDRDTQLTYLIALGSVFIDLNLGNSPYSLNAIDNQLIQLSLETYEVWSA